MSDYGVFEASSTDGHEEEQRQRQATRDLGRAIEAAREGFGEFLSGATDKQDYQDRLALVMNDLMQKVADSGVMPVPGVMRKVKAALRPKFRVAYKEIAFFDGYTGSQDDTNSGGSTIAVFSPSGEHIDTVYGNIPDEVFQEAVQLIYEHQGKTSSRKQAEKFQPGDKVMKSGYPGTVQNEYMDGMYEVRMERGTVVVPAEELTRVSSHKTALKWKDTDFNSWVKMDGGAWSLEVEETGGNFWVYFNGGPADGQMEQLSASSMEEAKAEAESIASSKGITASHKQAGVDSDVNSFVLYLQGIGYRMPKDAGYPGEGGELDDELYSYFKGDRNKIDEVTKFLQEKWDYYAYGIGGSRKTALQWYEAEDGWSTWDLDGTPPKGLSGQVVEQTDGRIQWWVEDPYDPEFGDVDHGYANSAEEAKQKVEETLSSAGVTSSRKQAYTQENLANGYYAIFYSAPSGKTDVDVFDSGDSLVTELTADSPEMARKHALEYVDSISSPEFTSSRKQASAYLPVISVEDDTGDFYMAELRGGFAFEASDEGGAWVWSIFDSSGEEVASDEAFSLEAAKDAAAYALERVASRKVAVQWRFDDMGMPEFDWESWWTVPEETAESSNGVQGLVVQDGTGRGGYNWLIQDIATSDDLQSGNADSVEQAKAEVEQAMSRYASRK